MKQVCERQELGMDILKSELREFVAALREICAVCAKPFGKDARAARRIARDALAKWGYVNPKGVEAENGSARK